jgi:hypothetical protein
MFSLSLPGREPGCLSGRSMSATDRYRRFRLPEAAQHAMATIRLPASQEKENRFFEEIFLSL